MTLTVHSAGPEDVWPDGPVYPPEIEREIFRVARQEITADDVARSGCKYASWYTRFHLAEGRVLSRREKLQVQQVDELSRRVAALERELVREKQLRRVLIGDKGEIQKWFIEGIRGALAMVRKEIKPPELAFEMMGRDLIVRSGPHTQVFTLPFPMDVGVWAENRGYAQGDGVSHQGSWWIAQRDTSAGEKPGIATGAWRLSVKHGRDAPRTKAPVAA